MGALYAWAMRIIKLAFAAAVLGAIAYGFISS